MSGLYQVPYIVVDVFTQSRFGGNQLAVITDGNGLSDSLMQRVSNGCKLVRGEPNSVKRVNEFVPMKRGGTADEVANAVWWLLSNEAPHTTGSSIDVTGGK